MHRVFLFSGIAALMVCSCRNVSQTAQTNVKKHQVEIALKGVGMLYMDQVPNTSIMKIDSTGDTEFYSFLVGFVDSNLMLKPDTARGVYFQYNMYKDWKAVVKNDTIIPVFFHPKVGINTHEEEGVLVFEVPKGLRPDELIYKDSYGPWGTRTIVFNN